MNRLLCLLLAAISPQAFAFVLISGPTEAKLDASTASPTVQFVLADDLPSLSGKSNFMGGKYADLDDQAFWAAMVTEMMAIWNNVEDSYLQLEITTDTTANADEDDGVNSIVKGSTSASAAAFAAPRIEDAKIEDCDITVSSSKGSAKSVAFTILHELGHCIGLGHNHSNYNSIMSYSRDANNLKLGLDDEVGIVYLYPNDDVDDPKETFGCGSIALSDQKRHHLPWLILLSLLLPLLSASPIRLRR